MAGLLRKLAKSGVFGLAGLAATNKGAVNKIARNGGFGVTGMMMAKRKGEEEDLRRRRQAMNSPRMEPVRVSEVEEITEQPAMRKGGKVKKMAKGGSSASKRADGCAIKGKTKGRMV